MVLDRPLGWSWFSDLQVQVLHQAAVRREAPGT
jgi:hypothetical protein